MDKVAAYIFARAIDDWTVLTGNFDFDSIFPNEEVCRAYVYQQRWPSGFFCPRCGDVCSYEMHNRELIECANRDCRCQVSITSGTIFHRSKLPLRKWLKALQLFTRHGVTSPTVLKRHIKVSYKTAWLMIRKLGMAFKYYDQEMLRDLTHPLAAILSDPFMEEASGYSDEALMTGECTDGPEEEGILPDVPEAAAACAAAGLLLYKKITKEEWMHRKWMRKVMFRLPRHYLRSQFLLHLVCCTHSPPLYRILRNTVEEPNFFQIRRTLKAA